MEVSNQDKKQKSVRRTTEFGSIRVKKETRKRFISELAKVNKKDFGKRVSADALVNLALGLIMPEHLKDLQERSLSNADRFERDYRAYVSKHGHVTKDEYLGLRLNSQLNPARGESNEVAEGSSN